MANSDYADLDLNDDRAVQERHWRIERAAWFIMALVAAAALAGLTGGGGPLAKGHVTAGELTIEYPRIARRDDAEEMIVQFPAAETGEAEILLPESLLNVFAIESVTPQPAEVIAGPQGQTFRFTLDEARGPKRVHFAIRASRPALPTTATAQFGASSAELSFVVLP